MKNRLYTLGEIHRLGLLKNHRGGPYRHKASILKVVLGLKYKKVKTPWGMGYAVLGAEIARHNKKHAQ